jgi:hypothetical protein
VSAVVVDAAVPTNEVVQETTSIEQRSLSSVLNFSNCPASFPPSRATSRPLRRVLVVS